MKATKTQLINQRLSALRELCPDLEAAAVISVEGLMIASALPETLEDNLMAAMTAAMLALGERIAMELNRGQLSQVTIKGEAGYVLLMAIDDGAVLTALAANEAKLGLVFLDMREAVSDLRRIL